MMNFDPVQEEYSRLAHIYDQRWSFYVHATIHKTIQRLDIYPHERVLDIGCGTGSLLRQLLHLFPAANYVGLDPSVEMLKIARQKLPTSVELQVSSAHRLPFSDESFDVIISTSAFHYFRQPTQVLQEVKRILKPNGRLIITDWCHDYWTCYLFDIFLRLLNRAHFRTYGVKECQTLLQLEGFRKVFIERYKIDWFWGMMTAQAAKGTAEPVAAENYSAPNAPRVTPS